MRIETLGIMCLLLGAGPATAQSPEAPADIMPKVGVPRDRIVGSPDAQVMTPHEAFGHWNGHTELLLMPPDEDPAQGNGFAGFQVAAAFSNEGEDGAKAQDCFRGVVGAQMANGTLQIEEFPTASPASSRPVAMAVDGSGAHLLQSGRCRYTLRMSAKLMRDGKWQSVEGPHSMPFVSTTTVYPIPATIDVTNRLVDLLHSKHSELTKSHQTSAEEAAQPTFFRELVVDAVRFTLAGFDAGSKEGHGCPRLSGVIAFSPDGLHLKAPWAAEGAITPGLSRDPDHRVTTLIVQNMDCRLELQVTREVGVDGGWHRSPLAPIPNPMKSL